MRSAGSPERSAEAVAGVDMAQLAPGKPGARVLGCDAHAVADVCDDVVPPGSHDQLESLALVEVRREDLPEVIGDGARVVQLVGESNDARLLGVPAGLARVPVDRGVQLRLGESQRNAEGDGVHAPLVLGPGERARAMDHDLSQQWRDGGAGAEDSGTERAHAARELLVYDERAKQTQRLDRLPGAIHLASVACISGVYGGCSGAMRGAVAGIGVTLPSILLLFSEHRAYRFDFKSATADAAMR